MSEATSKAIEKVFEDDDKNIEQVMKKVDAIQTKIKFESLGKGTLKKKVKTKDKQLDKVTSKAAANDLLTSQMKRVDKELKELKKKAIVKWAKCSKLPSLLGEQIKRV